LDIGRKEKDLKQTDRQLIKRQRKERREGRKKELQR
jgi:hypothetical protein